MSIFSAAIAHWLSKDRGVNEPLILTTSHRRELINKAMTGASVAEQLTLVNHAFQKLSLTEKNNLVRKWDRDQWAEMKP